MKDFNHTANLLVSKYNDKSLKSKQCDKCAVGQIVCDAGNTTFYWKTLFVTDASIPIQRMAPKYRIDQPDQIMKWGLREIHATGYTVDELARVEYAFEIGSYRKKDGYKTKLCGGLIAALKVLADIHGVDAYELEQVKQKIK